VGTDRRIRWPAQTFGDGLLADETELDYGKLLKTASG
jgi:hypothetical protein